MAVTIAVPKELKAGELRVALTPSVLPKLRNLGALVTIEHGAGAGIHAPDQAYQGASIAQTLSELYHQSKIILKVQPPTLAEVQAMPDHAILISFLYPAFNKEIVALLLQKNLTSLAMELVPRISRAQDLDALSSQATISGYKAVLLAANQSNFFFPMLTTAAGSMRPAKVFVMGVGVAGLQAIATAKRLGAQVSAYDLRPETKEQTQSLGAKFLELDVASGRADSSPEAAPQLSEARLQEHLASCDVVITTAGILGKPAPKLISKQMIELMKPGAIIVDAMAEMGGNCELTQLGATVAHHGVTIIGPSNLPSMLAKDASEMYARNMMNLLKMNFHNQQLQIDWQDEIIAKMLVTHQGALVNQEVKRLLEES